MSRQPTGLDGPVLAGLIGASPAEAALRRAFAEADRRGVALRVILAGTAPAEEDRHLGDLIERWSEKYPGVPVRAMTRRGIDAAVTLTAASRGCALLITQRPADANSSLLVTALSRRACCPVVVVPAAAEPADPS